jgi:hypothetical protein
VTEVNVKDLKRALVGAGFEIFRVRDDEVHIAERQNVQLMEAGIRARAGATPRVSVVARAQRNDAQSMSEVALFEMIRARNAPLLAAGYREVHAGAREIRSVSDADHVLDVWYEITYERPVASIEESVEEVRRALDSERYIVPHR